MMDAACWCARVEVSALMPVQSHRHGTRETARPPAGRVAKFVQALGADEEDFRGNGILPRAIRPPLRPRHDQRRDRERADGDRGYGEASVITPRTSGGWH